MACVASASIWASTPATTSSTPLRPWNTKYATTLSLDLTIPGATPIPLSISIPQQHQQQQQQQQPAQKPRLRLPTIPSSSSNDQMPPTRRFDPFAEESSSLPYLQQQETQNTPAPAPVAATAAVGPAPRGRRRSPSFSAGSGSTRSSLPPSLISSPNVLSITYGAGFAGSHSSSASPAPSLTRPSLPSRNSAPSTSTTVPAVPLAPSPFHARHYPTSDARARLLARTLLNRINVVGRPRSPYSSSSSLSSSSCYGGCADGYESSTECGRRAYIPSRLSECVVAAC